MSTENHDEEIIYHETFQPFFFFPYSVTVTKSRLSFGYYFWLFTTTLDRSQIVSATPLDDVKGLREWGGWGIRLRRHDEHWETGYIAKNGGAVKIEVASGSENGSSSWFVFSCQKPKDVCRLLCDAK
jgi:hypothetical protein